MSILLARLLSGQNYLLGVDDYDKVTHINMRGKGWLVLAAKKDGGMASEATEYNSFGIDDMPLTTYVTGFRRKSAHEISHFLLQLEEPCRASSRGARLPAIAHAGQKEADSMENASFSDGFSEIGQTPRAGTGAEAVR
jgi:hypothetical protein